MGLLAALCFSPSESPSNHSKGVRNSSSHGSSGNGSNHSRRGSGTSELYFFDRNAVPGKTSLKTSRFPRVGSVESSLADRSYKSSPDAAGGDWSTGRGTSRRPPPIACEGNPGLFVNTSLYVTTTSLYANTAFAAAAANASAALDVNGDDSNSVIVHSKLDDVTYSPRGSIVSASKLSLSQLPEFSLSRELSETLMSEVADVVAAGGLGGGDAATSVPPVVPFERVSTTSAGGTPVKRVAFRDFKGRIHLGGRYRRNTDPGPPGMGDSVPIVGTPVEPSKVFPSGPKEGPKGVIPISQEGSVQGGSVRGLSSVSHRPPTKASSSSQLVKAGSLPTKVSSMSGRPFSKMGSVVVDGSYRGRR